MINVVGALLVRGHSFLLAQRAYGDLKGHWEFPGGKVNESEDFFDAIKRELKEELNLDIIPQKVVDTFTHHYPFATIQLTLVSCLLASESPPPISDGSHLDHAWVTLESIRQPLAPLDSKIVDYLKNINGSETILAQV
jgi:8-oxo-dGTP diphosphatase